MSRIGYAVWVTLAGLACVASQSSPSAAQSGDWPNKSVRIVVNFGPGGSADNSARPFAERLSKALGQQFVIENRGGASGALGIEAVVKSPPDGYTYVVTPALSTVILPHLRKTPYDPLKDLAPVTRFTTGTLVFATHPTVPAKTVPELVDWAKKNSRQLTWGTAGVGSFGHIMCEVFKIESGLDILHVPYRGGGESLADFLAGTFQIHADPNTFPHIAAGKVNLLAVLDNQRHPDYPKVPLLKEFYPSMDFVVWFAIYGPAGTPKPIIDKFAAEMNKIARQPDIEPLLRKAALAPFPGSPEDLADITRKDHARFGELIRRLNIKAE